MLKYYFNYYRQYKRSLQAAKRRRSSAPVSNSPYPEIGLINPSIGTTNMGDFIIYEAVYKHLRGIFPTAFLTNYPSQIHTSYDAKQSIGSQMINFIGGTNLLSSNMDEYYQWHIDPVDRYYIKNKVLLMGVGWWQYQPKPNAYTSKLLNTVLSKDYLHSVRDSYTLGQLKSIGITNVVNTTCPTLWELSPEHCATVRTKKGRKVITTLTFYKKNEDLDRRMLEILVDNYEEVFLWVQGVEDVSYMKRIFPAHEQVKLVPPTIEAYNTILEDPEIEYLGTRLHAGVRAIQKGVRTLILAVDNRAIEIGKDTNLNVISIKEVEKSLEFVNNDYVTDIKLPVGEIERWKAQFA
ncbi:MAG: polysaccharide pyruvyl transferase family protein [Chitinophagaceae bacterium]|nr:MAG: polysaccharide pyruvyl transferase family protein [Chitinophagaceae bacterium]